MPCGMPGRRAGGGEGWGPGGRRWPLRKAGRGPWCQETPVRRAGDGAGGMVLRVATGVLQEWAEHVCEPRRRQPFREGHTSARKQLPARRLGQGRKHPEGESGLRGVGAQGRDTGYWGEWAGGQRGQEGTAIGPLVPQTGHLYAIGPSVPGEGTCVKWPLEKATASAGDGSCRKVQCLDGGP